MTFIEAYSIAEAAQGFLQLFCQNQLVAQQCVRIRKAGVYLYGPCEKLNGNVVLPLQAETVSGYTPGLCTERERKKEPQIRKTGDDNAHVEHIPPVFDLPLVSFCPCLWDLLKGRREPHPSADARVLWNRSPYLLLDSSQYAALPRKSFPPGKETQKYILVLRHATQQFTVRIV